MANAVTGFSQEVNRLKGLVNGLQKRVTELSGKVVAGPAGESSKPKRPLPDPSDRPFKRLKTESGDVVCQSSS